MTYHQFKDDWMTLTVAMESDQVVTESVIRETLRQLIEQEVDWGNNPWETVNSVELREADWGEDILRVWMPGYLTDEDEEATEEDWAEEIEELTDKVMRTQELETAVRWMRNKTPEEAVMSYEPGKPWIDPEDGEEYETEEPTLMDFLYNLKLTEHDSGEGMGYND